ncbi:MAG: response regulator transcription factor [Candidatus Dormibacteraeota bacterium]|nr:response regulator transcription factor [Candidatus Dormibacteraeota bacterium]
MTLVLSPGPDLLHPRPPGSRPRVLVIDRQPLFQLAMRSLLTGAPIGAEIETVTDSARGVELALSGPADLVLCDALARPLTGEEVVRRLADADPRVPVILLGELDELTPTVSLLLHGAAGLFTKNVAAEELLAGVAAVLEGHLVMGSKLLETALASRSQTLPPGGPIACLSVAEKEVFTLLGQGRPVAAIASLRGVSPKTVRNHMAAIYRKLELRNRTEAMLVAARMGLVAP